MRLAAIGIAILLLGAGGALADDGEERTQRRCVSNQVCLTDYEHDTRADGDCEYGGDAQGRPEYYEHKVTLYVGLPLVVSITTSCHSDQSYVNRHVFVDVLHAGLGYEHLGAEWSSNHERGQSCGLRAFGVGGASSTLGFRSMACPTYLEPPMLPSLP